MITTYTKASMQILLPLNSCIQNIQLDLRIHIKNVTLVRGRNELEQCCIPVDSALQIHVMLFRNNRITDLIAENSFHGKQKKNMSSKELTYDLSDAEWKRCLENLDKYRCRFFVQMKRQFGLFEWPQRECILADWIFS